MVVTADVLSQLRRGALEYCVLGLLAREERYGFDLVRSLGAMDGMVTGEGTVYPLLSRLQKDGRVASTWRDSGSAGSQDPLRFAEFALSANRSVS